MSALVYTVFPDVESAEATARHLLDERLIVCANVGGPIHALFDWRGSRGEGDEIAVLFKTDAAMLERAVARLDDLHPYEEPAIFGWPCAVAGASTRAWTGALSEGDRA